MGDKYSQVEVIEIDDSPCSFSSNSTPLRPVFCLKNRDQIEKFEIDEDCFILEFDPDGEIDLAKLSVGKEDNNPDADLCIVAEKGKVACRDYPHPRNTCAKFPFEKTAHDTHCAMCYCFVCDVVAPCKTWNGTSGHCHAINNAAWNNEKIMRRGNQSQLS